MFKEVRLLKKVRPIKRGSRHTIWERAGISIWFSLHRNEASVTLLRISNVTPWGVRYDRIGSVGIDANGPYVF